MRDPGVFSARGVSKKAVRDAMEAIRVAKSADGSISHDDAQRCVDELAHIFLRGADKARDRQKAARAPAGASSRSHGSANHVEKRIGAISGLLSDIATGQAHATDDDASEPTEN